MSATRRGGLGRGLGALIPTGDDATASLRELPLSAIQANPRQPRGVFDDDELEGLAASIRDVGVLQPVVVRPLDEDRFELIAGERRLRAAKRAGLARIPSVVRLTDDRDLLKEALIENIHRVELNPLEEGAAYEQLLEDFAVTQEELAERLGKARSTISNAMRLLSLPAAVQRRVAAGVVTAGHAKALLGLDTREDQEAVADRIVQEGLSVRATEELVRLRYVGSGPTSGGSDSSRSRRSRPLPAGMDDLQADLADALGQTVRIRMGARKGTLTIDFRRPEELERLVELIAAGLSATGAGAEQDGPAEDEARADPEV